MPTLRVYRDSGQKTLFGAVLVLVLAAGALAGYRAVETSDPISYFAAFAALFATVSVVRLIFVLPSLRVVGNGLSEQRTAWTTRNHRFADITELRLAPATAFGRPSTGSRWLVPVMVLRDGTEVRLTSAVSKPDSTHHRRVVEFVDEINKIIPNRR
ncbi:hypothetical protein [Actinokineospora enzanensis]|uniref:hypothetical protein n=1 Tax=Actinokineospora enzanensis TaxID=155975 RepID=UPI00036085FD|nr:hypothetical protein [Actinokineospora enzanensis]